MTRSKRQKELWRNPVYRQRQCDAMSQAWTDERKEKLRKRLTGRKLSQETINKISESNIRTWRKNAR